MTTLKSKTQFKMIYQEGEQQYTRLIRKWSSSTDDTSETVEEYQNLNAMALAIFEAVT